MLVLSQDERESIESGDATRVFNQLLETIAALKDYDTLVLMASDWRIQTMERILGTEVIGIPLGASPLRSDVPVDLEELDRVLTSGVCPLAGAGQSRPQGRCPRRGRRSHREVEAVKEVVSVSIGSSSRDHEVEIDLLGERFRIRREGYDGDLDAAAARFAELDGTVDAFGMGGIDIYLRADGRKYFFRDAKKLIKGSTARRSSTARGSRARSRARPSTIWSASAGWSLPARRC